MIFTTATLLALALAGAVDARPANFQKSRSLVKKSLPKLGGVNLSGFDFGCGTDGTCTAGGYVAPSDGFSAQIDAFVALGANLFRIPVGWQYLVGSTIGGAIDPTFFALYDAAVQNCLSSGSYCIIDPHNYARWDGAIIGASGAPTAAQFGSFWQELAAKYATDDHVIFSLMNEPHDLTDVQGWADAMQLAVTGIRAAGATSQYIILNGNDWTHATGWTSGGDDPILKITDSDGSTTMLLLDIHEYLDTDDSGTHDTCTTDNVALFQGVQTYLAGIGRTGIVTETGESLHLYASAIRRANNDATCITDLGSELSTIISSDNLAGFAVWGAGEFDSSYVLSLYPINDLDTQAIQPNLPGNTGAVASSTVASSASSSSSVGGITVTAADPTSTVIPSSSSTLSASFAGSSSAYTVSSASSLVVPATGSAGSTSALYTSALALSSSVESEASTSSVHATSSSIAVVSAVSTSTAYIVPSVGSSSSAFVSPIVTASPTASTCAAQKTVTITVIPGAMTSSSSSARTVGDNSTLIGSATSGVANSTSVAKTKSKSHKQKTSSATGAAVTSASSVVSDVIPTASASTGVASSSDSIVAVTPTPLAANLATSGSASATGAAVTSAVQSAVTTGSAASCPAGSPGRKRSLSPAQAAGRALM